MDRTEFFGTDRAIEQVLLRPERMQIDAQTKGNYFEIMSSFASKAKALAYPITTIGYGLARSIYYAHHTDQSKKKLHESNVAQLHGIDAKHVPPAYGPVDIGLNVLLNVAGAPVLFPFYIASDLIETRDRRKQYIAPTFKFPFLLYDLNPLRYVPRTSIHRTSS